MPDRIARVWTGSQWEVITSNSPSPNAVVTYQSASPSGPVTGQVWVNSGTNIVNVWSGSAWVATNIDASNITSGTLAVARGGTGTTTSTGSGSTVLSASPALTGTPTAPTPSASVNTTQIATTAFVYNQGPLFTNRNLLYNGAMQVSQRGTSTTSITTAGYYTADRYNTSIGSFGTWTQDIQNDAPTGSGFRRSLRMLCTTADAAPAAGDILRIQQKIEGQDAQRIGSGTASAKRITLSFWVKSNVTGTYICEFENESASRTVSAAYTVSASATWEKKTITLPADTSGTFTNDNTAALTVNWWLGAGSTFTSGTLQTTWGTYVNANRVVGQVNLGSAINNYWQVTGVQLEVGDVATDFEFKSYGQELRECQRYYEQSYSIGTAAGTNTVFGLQQGLNGTDGNQINGIRWIVPKRTTPVSTTVYSKIGTVASLSTTGYVNAANTGSWSINDANEFGFRCIVGTGGLTSGVAYTYHYICSAEL